MLEPSDLLGVAAGAALVTVENDQLDPILLPVELMVWILVVAVGVDLQYHRPRANPPDWSQI